ncbi:unnamed protein product [Paramecium octaurelia]|uniref:Uncharacterized protein n=1 Tax=Paramecium octaurelia TaxID=43137 RepID=A0A8S1X8Z3_PAROT|nr:unnamed protein product [Paramecium octaurelia]
MYSILYFISNLFIEGILDLCSFDNRDLDILIKNFLGEEGISRTSYEHHLKMAENDKEYKLKEEKQLVDLHQREDQDHMLLIH